MTGNYLTLLIISASASILFEASQASADAYQSLANQRNMLPGGKAALLGGAFVAVASDSSASFYNPAGLALIKQDRFDMSATSYANSEIVYHEAVNEDDFNERSEVTYPSFFGATTRLGPLSVGYSYMTLDAHNIYQQDKYADISTVPGAANTYSRTYQERSAYIYGGGSVALKVSDSLAIGTSLFYYQRNLEYSTHELVQLNGGGIVAINSTMKTLNTGAAGVYGVLWKQPKYSVGVSVRMAMALSDRSIMLSDTVDYDPDSPGVNDDGKPIPNIYSIQRKAKELNELNPTTYTLGTAFHPTSWFLLSADVLVHEGTKSLYKDYGGADLKMTLNYSTGMMIRLGPIELLGGYFTNNSMYRAPDSDLPGQPIHVDYVGQAAGLGFDFGGFQGYLGGTRQVGHGEAQIRNNDSTIQKVDGAVTTYMIAGNLAL